MTVQADTAPRHGFLRRALYWLEPRWRDPGWLAFFLNRLSGHILVLYLLAHMVVLSLLIGGREGWNSLLAIFGSTPFLIGDTLLIAAVTYHGLNGLRVTALTFGWGSRHPSLLFGVVFAASVVITLLAGWMILL